MEAHWRDAVRHDLRGMVESWGWPDILSEFAGMTRDEAKDQTRSYDDYTRAQLNHIATQLAQLANWANNQGL